MSETEEVEEGGDFEEYEPREVMIPEESVAIPDLDAMTEMVNEMTGGSAVAWQYSGGGLFVLVKYEKAFQWQSIESLDRPKALKAVK